MTNYRTFADVTVEYFTKRPEEIDDFLTEIFADFAEDGDSATLLSALCIIARVKGVSAMSVENDIPRLDDVNTLIRAMGYQLTPISLSLKPHSPKPQETAPA